MRDSEKNVKISKNCSVILRPHPPEYIPPVRGSILGVEGEITLQNQSFLNHPDRTVHHKESEHQAGH